MKRFLVFALFHICFFKYASAQTETLPYDSLKRFCTDYISSYKDTSVGISLISSNKYNRFEIYNASLKSMKFRPNEQIKFGFGFDYKWLGIKLAIVHFSTSKRKNILYGKTKQFDLQGHIYLRKHVVDAYYQNYKGFYIENPKEFNPLWDISKQFPQRQDIRTSSVGASYKYIYNNKKYSYRASFTQTESQKKSAGSFLFGGFFSMFRVAGDSSLISYPSSNLFTSESKFKIENVICLGVSMGYIYTLVLKKKWFVTFSFVPGIAFQEITKQSKIRQFDTKKIAVSLNAQTRFATGYNGLKNYFGVLAVSEDYNLQNLNSSQLKYTSGIIRFFVGRRFDGDDFFKKKTKEYENE